MAKWDLNPSLFDSLWIRIRSTSFARIPQCNSGLHNRGLFLAVLLQKSGVRLSRDGRVALRSCWGIRHLSAPWSVDLIFVKLYPAKMEDEKKGKTSLKKVFPELAHNSFVYILLARIFSLLHLIPTSREARNWDILAEPLYNQLKIRGFFLSMKRKNVSGKRLAQTPNIIYFLCLISETSSLNGTS